MAQKTRKWKLVLTSVAMLVVMIFGMALSAHAARDIPSIVRGYPGSINEINMTLEKGEYIKVTAAKGLKYKITYENWRVSDYESNTEASAEISYYTKKKGDYTVKFDIYNAETNTKVSSASVKVDVRDDSPFKKVTVNGKEYMYADTYLTTKKSVKFKVTMNKGYKLKKLEVGTYSAPKKDSEDDESIESKMEYKTFKNGGKINLGTRGYYYLYEYSYTSGNGKTTKYHHLSDSLTAYTSVRITYIDKWTKQETTTTYGFTKLL